MQMLSTNNDCGKPIYFEAHNTMTVLIYILSTKYILLDAHRTVSELLSDNVAKLKKQKSTLLCYIYLCTVAKLHIPVRSTWLKMHRMCQSIKPPR